MKCVICGNDASVAVNEGRFFICKDHYLEGMRDLVLTWERWIHVKIGYLSIDEALKEQKEEDREEEPIDDAEG